MTPDRMFVFAMTSDEKVQKDYEKLMEAFKGFGEETDAEELAEAILLVAGPNQVDAGFEKLKSRDADTRKKVVDAFEKYVIDDIRLMAKYPTETIEDLSPEEIEQFDENSAVSGMGSLEEWDTATLDSLQATCQTLFNISKIKGDQISPAIKAVIQELSKLSSEEYNSTKKLEAALIKTCNIETAPEVKPIPKATSKTPNPFGPK